jgi:hypothetical protein
MATLRTDEQFYDIGNLPPEVLWTVVRRDTASFKVYVTDDARAPLNLADWTIEMQIRRGINKELILTLTPAPDVDDNPGEFTVTLSSEQSEELETDDIFDIQLSNATYVWTVAMGKMRIIEDVTI